MLLEFSGYFACENRDDKMPVASVILWMFKGLWTRVCGHAH